VEESPVRDLLLTLWRDDAGIVALEYLLLATIVGLGLVVGLAAVESALDSELTELANAITTLDQSYSFAGQAVGCPGGFGGSGGGFAGPFGVPPGTLAWKSGSAAFDAPSSLALVSSPAVTQNINIGNCP
jgi:Flp pilus assembly pilin Flp